MTLRSSSRLLDSERLAALYHTELLDSNTDERFDRLTRLAAHALKAPVSLISLVDKDRQFLKSCVGTEQALGAGRHVPLSHSHCQYVVESGQSLAVTDAATDEFFRDHPATRDMGIRAYLGMPLITSDGHTLGSFCVIDIKPRDWTARDKQVVKDLSEIVMAEIELRIRLRMAVNSVDALTDKNDRLIDTLNQIMDESAPRRLISENGVAVPGS